MNNRQVRARSGLGLWLLVPAVANLVVLLQPSCALEVESAVAPALLRTGANEYQRLLSTKRCLDCQQAEIEEQKRTFNADCSWVSSWDNAKIEECKRRREQLMALIRAYRAKLAQYKADNRKIESAQKSKKQDIFSSDAVSSLVMQVADSSWPFKAKAAFLVAFVRATQGRYDEALKMAQQAAQLVPNDPLIEEALQDLRARVLSAQTGLSYEKADAVRRLVEQVADTSWPFKAKADFLTAFVMAVEGRYDEALKMAHQAAQLAPNDPLIESALEDLRIRRNLEEVSRDPQHPKRLLAKANSAWKLGHFLAEQGKYDQALQYFKEARKTMPPDKANEIGLLDRIIADVRQLPAKPEKQFPIYRSRTDALLDAFEYGNGKAELSSEYLDAAYKANPDDLAVRDAFNYLLGMQGQSASQTNK